MSSRLFAMLVCVGAFVALAWAAPAVAHADDTRRARAHARQAKAYFDAGDFAHAIEEYQAAYELDHKPTRLYNLAVCHERQGDRKGALVLYRQYLEAEPDGEAAQLAAEAIASLSMALDQEAREQAARDAEAAEAAKRAQAAEASKRAEAEAQAEQHAQRAESLARQGSFAAAATQLLAAYELDPSTPRYLWLAGEAYRQAGDRKRARAQYRRYLAADPTGEHAADARLQLDTPGVPALSARPPGRVLEEPTPVAPYKPPRWLWPALAGAAVVAGVALDTVPDSARDGRLQASDFLPLGFYGLGVVFAVWSF